MSDVKRCVGVPRGDPDWLHRVDELGVAGASDNSQHSRGRCRVAALLEKVEPGTVRRGLLVSIARRPLVANEVVAGSHGDLALDGEVQQLGGKAERTLLVLHRFLALPVGVEGSPAGENGEGQQGDACGPGGADGAALLADLFRFELVLGDAMDRRGDVGDSGPERRVVQVEMLVGSCETQIHPPRIAPERPVQRRGRGVGRRGDVTVGPTELTVGHHREDAIGAAVLQPVLDLLVHPARLGSLRREQQDEPLGLIHRLGDRSPQMRTGTQRRLITEDVEGPALPPRLGEPLQTRLESRGEQVVGVVGVGNEPVVQQPPRRPMIIQRGLGLCSCHLSLQL